MRNPVQVFVALAMLAVAGCMSLSSEERRLLGKLEEHGYGVASPPPGFKAPVEVWTAAGLNALPGVGNFYLAYEGGGTWQWVLGTANLLLWPISPCWAVVEGGWDARTMNQRALVAFCREKARDGKKLPSRTSTGKKSGASGGVSEKSAQAPYEIATEEAFADGRAVYRVTITDPGMTAFDVVRLVKPEIETILRDAFATWMPGFPPDAIRAYVVPEFAENRVVRFRGWAFAMKPIAEGWSYDPETRRGVARFRISGGMPPDEAKRWARENIEAIVQEKNVALKAGMSPPDGARYWSLGETLQDGVLTVEFESL